MDDNADATQLAASIIAAYVSHNSVPTSELVSLIATVHQSIKTLANGGAAAPVAEKAPEPAVSIKKSITPDFIICLESGKKFKSLKRHLASAYDMTPDQYREKWNLPHDYPMVAPSYSATRSSLAKANGLGNTRVPPSAVKAPAGKAKGKKTA